MFRAGVRGRTSRRRGCAAAIALCVFAACTDASPYGSMSQTVHDGDPDIFMMGQSNADRNFARAVADATGLSIHQISHGRQPIAHWFAAPYEWLAFDLDFLGERRFDTFVWFHGESNAESWIAYETRFAEIVAAVSPDRAPVVIVVGIWRDDVDVEGFRAFQRAMCDRHPGWHYVESRDAPRRDAMHLSAEGRALVAERIATLLAGL